MIFRRRKRARERASAEDAAESAARTGAEGAAEEGVPPLAEPAEPVEPTEPGVQVDPGVPMEPAGEAESSGAAESDGENGSKRPGIIAGTREALAPVKRRHLLIASLGLMGFSVAGVFVFSAVSFWWTSQPSFCNRCHVMEPYVAEWKQSPHRDVNCESCHLTPGFFGYLGGKIAGLQVVANYIRGDYKDWSFNAAVSNNACLQCHESILNGDIHDKATGITVSHANIIGMGAKCVQCHSTIAHGTAVAIGSQTHPTMATCLRCHNDKIAPLRCDLCHSAREPPSGTPTPPTVAAAAG